MKLNKEQLLKINEINNFIIDYCEYFADYEEELIFSEERIKEIIDEQEDIETIDYNFPGEEEYTSLEPEELIAIESEIKSINIINNGLIKTNLRSYYVVALTDSEDDYRLRTYHEIGMSSLNGIKVNLAEQSYYYWTSRYQIRRI